jgi:hypothetical protein
MNSRHPQGIGMMTTEGQLQDELLRTWEEYYSLLVEIVSHLSPEKPQLWNDFQSISECSPPTLVRPQTAAPNRKSQRYDVNAF